jgi:ribosomal protein L11 methyltransferase
MNKSGNTSLARLVCDETTAKRLSDTLAETLEADETAVAAFEAPDGRWIVEIHFETPPDEAAIRRLIADVTDAGVTFDTVEQKDWVAASLADLKPVVAGRFTVHGAHDRAAVGPHRIGIEIEAALAFGTGHHGTTRGCLLALDGLLKERRPRRILDVGTGTGVLAIALAKRTRSTVIASDIDPISVTTTIENAAQNGVGTQIVALEATGVNHPTIQRNAPYDLIVANILAGPLMALAPAIGKIAQKGAVVILSGILQHQARGVINAYARQGMVLNQKLQRKDWTTLILEMP